MAVTTTSQGFPRDFDAYLQLCERQGTKPLLDARSFETTVAEMREAEVPGNRPDRLMAAFDKGAMAILDSYDATVHLAELVEPGNCILRDIADKSKPS